MSSFVWPCAILLCSSEQGSSQTSAVPWLALFREHGWQILLWHGSPTRAHTHLQTHARKVIMWHPCLEARVTHANETGPASSRQHSVILHSSASLQKPKSFSPPSPISVTLMERRSGNHLFSHTVRRTHKPFSLSVSFSLKKKKALHTQLPILHPAPDTCSEQKLICKVTEFLLIQRRWSISRRAQGYKVQSSNSEISSVSFRSMSQQ